MDLPWREGDAMDRAGVSYHDFFTLFINAHSLCSWSNDIGVQIYPDGGNAIAWIACFFGILGQ